MSIINEFIEKLIGKQRKEKKLLIEEGKISNPSPNIEEQTNEQKEIRVEYYSKVENGIHKHDVRINYDGEVIPLGNLSNKKDEDNIEYKTDETIRDIVREIESNIRPLSKAESIYELDDLKEKVKDILQQISHKNPNFVVDEEIMDFIDNFKSDQTSEQLNYKEINNYLTKAIDVKKLTEEQKKKISTQMETRMKELGEIHTPDDAWEDRGKILSFIKSIENIPSNPLVIANIKSKKQGKELNEETSKLVAREIKNIENEDGALYSVYLKIEEKRIWKKIKLTISKNAEDNEMNKEDLNKLMESIGKLNTYELHDIQSGLSSEILTYIIEQMKEMDTEKYLEEIKYNDALLAKMINSKFPNMESKDKILPFFYNRMACLGQLSNKKENILRKFIETTDFKDEDYTETKQFLLLASQIERTYIENLGKDLIESKIKANTNAYETTKTNTFKEKIAYNVNTDERKTNSEPNKANIEKSEDFTKE